jgi:hypothetical protein
MGRRAEWTIRRKYVIFSGYSRRLCQVRVMNVKKINFLSIKHLKLPQKPGDTNKPDKSQGA